MMYWTLYLGNFAPKVRITDDDKRVAPAGKRPGRMISIIAIIIIVFVLLLLYSNMALTYSRYEKMSSKLPVEFDGFKIVLVSDLHGKSFGKSNSILTGMIDIENPDIVLMSGDMVSGKDDLPIFYELAYDLGRRYETYYIYGNHEARFEADVLEEMNNNLEEYGINIINNEVTVIERNGASIALYGLTLPLYFYSGTNEDGNFIYEPTVNEIDDYFEYEQDIDKNMFKMLLTHTPLYFDTYAEWGADIVFCGHIHGGVVRIPFIGGIFSPHKELFPHYDAGEYTAGASTLILSRGMGEHSGSVRLFNPADLCVITLKAEDRE